jgi:hypothetical protein
LKVEGDETRYFRVEGLLRWPVSARWAISQHEDRINAWDSKHNLEGGILLKQAFKHLIISMTLLYHVTGSDYR